MYRVYSLIAVGRYFHCVCEKPSRKESQCAGGTQAMCKHLMILKGTQAPLRLSVDLFPTVNERGQPSIYQRQCQHAAAQELCQGEHSRLPSASRLLPLTLGKPAPLSWQSSQRDTGTSGDREGQNRELAARNMREPGTSPRVRAGWSSAWNKPAPTNRSTSTDLHRIHPHPCLHRRRGTFPP